MHMKQTLLLTINKFILKSIYDGVYSIVCIVSTK